MSDVFRGRFHAASLDITQSVKLREETAESSIGGLGVPCQASKSAWLVHDQGMQHFRQHH